MASLNDFIKNLNGGKSSVKPNQNQYISSSSGKPATGAYSPNSAMLSGKQANYLNPAAYAQPIDMGGQTLGSYTYGGGGGGGGGGYGGAVSVDTSGLQNTARNLIQSIQNAYHSLSGQITPVVQDKVNQYLQNYDTQSNDLNHQFGIATGQTQNLYGARGLQDSSFLGNALDENSNIYNQSLNSLNQDKSQKLGAIGQYAKGLQTSADAASNQYGQYLNDLGNYSAGDLQSLNSSLQGALPGIQSQVAGMGTNADFLNTLNQYAPAANQGGSQLAGKLQQLVTSSAPIFAKKQIAAGLVKSANLQDSNAQSYWNDYFNQLLNGQG